MEKLVEQFHALPHYGLMPKSGQEGKPVIGIRLEAGTLLVEAAGKEHHGSTEYSKSDYKNRNLLLNLV